MSSARLAPETRLLDRGRERVGRRCDGDSTRNTSIGPPATYPSGAAAGAHGIRDAGMLGHARGGAHGVVAGQRSRNRRGLAGGDFLSDPDIADRARTGAGLRRSKDDVVEVPNRHGSDAMRRREHILHVDERVVWTHGSQPACEFVGVHDLVAAQRVADSEEFRGDRGTERRGTPFHAARCRHRRHGTQQRTASAVVGVRLGRTRLDSNAACHHIQCRTLP
jgi:hypothetical protein